MTCSPVGSDGVLFRYTETSAVWKLSHWATMNTKDDPESNQKNYTIRYDSGFSNLGYNLLLNLPSRCLKWWSSIPFNHVFKTLFWSWFWLHFTEIRNRFPNCSSYSMQASVDDIRCYSRQLRTIWLPHIRRNLKFWTWNKNSSDNRILIFILTKHLYIDKVEQFDLTVCSHPTLVFFESTPSWSRFELENLKETCNLTSSTRGDKKWHFSTVFSQNLLRPTSNSRSLTLLFLC